MTLKLQYFLRAMKIRVLEHTDYSVTLLVNNGSSQITVRTYIWACFLGVSFEPRYINEFVYAPGSHNPSGMMTVPNISNQEMCAKVCYFNPMCVAFRYHNGLCTAYRILSGGPNDAVVDVWRRVNSPNIYSTQLFL